MITRPKSLLIGVFLASLCGITHAAEADPTEPVINVVPLDHPDQPLETTAPPSQFNVPDGEELWRRARERAANPVPEHRGGFFDFSELIGDDFRSAKDFLSERYSDTEDGSELQFVIRAEEARRDANQLHLKQMQLVYYISGTPAAKPEASTHSAPTKSPDPKAAHNNKEKEKKPDDSSELAGSLFAGGRMVITAPDAVIDILTNEGRALGSVKIEVFTKESPNRPNAVLSSERLRWRTWSEPSIGSTELAMYTCSESPGDPDPLVKGTYEIPQEGGPPSTLKIQGYGLIFETGTYETPTAVPDDDGRLAGLSIVARNRAIFHHTITMRSEATTMGALFPLGDAPAKEAPKTPGDTKTAPSADQGASLTVISCAGPAVIDMAVVPKKKPGKPDEKLQPILLARRFEFLNNVHLTKAPMDEKHPEATPEPTTVMDCRHLRMQYPAGSMPTPTTIPEYAEAVGGVTMRGTSAPPPDSSGASSGAPAGPFTVECQRIFHNGLTDNMFLVGTAAVPVHVKNEEGEAFAQQFDYRRRADTLTMPLNGPKKLIIRSKPVAAQTQTPADPKAPAAKPPSITTITWNGLLSREMRHIPVPGQADNIKEVLAFRDNVAIDQAGVLQMRGKQVTITKNAQDVAEYLHGRGDVTALMNGDQEATGESVSIETLLNSDGTPQLSPAGDELHVVTVTGNRTQDTKATLVKPGSAIRADKFIINQKTDSFDAFGGAVAVVKGAPPPATAAKVEKPVASSTIKSFHFDPNGDLFIQCDGDFSKDPTTHRIAIKKNAIIRQPGMQLFADEIYLTMENPPPPAAPAAPPPNQGGIFSGDLKSMECGGSVDLITVDQWIQCDHLSYEAAADNSILEMDEPDNDVRVYISEDDGSTKVLSVKRRLEHNGATGQFHTGGRMLMLPFQGKVPTARDKNSSPAKPLAGGRKP